MSRSLSHLLMSFLSSYGRLLVKFSLAILVCNLLLAVAPKITLPNRRIGQSLGRQTMLECMITAYPLEQSYWEKDARTVTSSYKYKIEAFDESEHSLTLSLTYSWRSSIVFSARLTVLERPFCPSILSVCPPHPWSTPKLQLKWSQLTFLMVTFECIGIIQ